MLDLKFLSSLEEIIGKTWSKSEDGWELVDCPMSPLQVADNFNLMSLFSANQTVLTQNSRTLIEVNCEKGAFNGRQQCENDHCEFTIRSGFFKFFFYFSYIVKKFLFREFKTADDIRSLNAKN